MERIQKMNIWSEIFVWISVKLRQLTEQKLVESEIECLINAVVLICKLIKQMPQNFIKLSEKYIQAETSQREGALNNIPDLLQSG